MSQDKLSMRQIMVICCGGLLSPISVLLPQMTAERGGAVGWWAPLLVLPVLLVMGWCILILFRGTVQGVGLVQVIQTAFGKWIGRALTALYFVWGIFLLGLFTRVAASRLSNAYQTDGTLAFTIVLLAMLLWMAIGKISAFGRASEVFYLALAGAVGAIVLFCLFKIKWEYAIPRNKIDLSKGVSAAVPVLGVLSMGIYGAVLGGWVKRQPQNKQRGFGWLIALCVATTLLLLVVTGRVGSVLEAKLNTPFFTLIEDIGVKGAFQRMEALVGAIWVLSDLMLLGMLVMACRAMMVEIVPLCKKAERWMGIPAIILGGALAIFLPKGVEENSFLWDCTMWGNLVFGVGVPVFVLLVAKLRKQR